MEQRIYFGACDNPMETFLDEARFTDALVYGILFQGDLVVPDIYFYNSTYVRNALAGDDKAKLAKFFLASVELGMVIPSFRGPSDRTFRDNLEGIEASRVQGMNAEHMQIAAKLDKAIYGANFNPHYWPQDAVSVGFKRTLERALQAATPGQESLEFSQIWDETRSLRLSLVEELRPDDLGGVRRGDLFNLALFHAKGVTGTVNNMTEIWSGLEPPRAALFERVLKWVNYCYHYNQSRMFDLKPSLAALDSCDIPFARHLALLDDGNGASTLLEFEVQVPSARSLLTIDPKVLLELRRSDEATNYFHALRSWQKQPSEEHAGVLEETLRTYASLLLATYHKSGGHLVNWKQYLRVHLPEGPSMWNGATRYTLRDSLIEVAPVLADAVRSHYASALNPNHLNLTELMPILSSLSAIGPLATGLYTFLPEKLRERLAPHVGARARIRIEIEQQFEKFEARGGTRFEENRSQIKANAVFQ